MVHSCMLHYCRKNSDGDLKADVKIYIQIKKWQPTSKQSFRIKIQQETTGAYSTRMPLFVSFPVLLDESINVQSTKPYLNICKLVS